MKTFIRIIKKDSFQSKQLYFKNSKVKQLLWWTMKKDLFKNTAAYALNMPWIVLKIKHINNLQDKKQRTE